VKVEVILITGRTINQGRGLMQGKESGYTERNCVVELGAAVLEQLGLQAGDLVGWAPRLEKEYLGCRLADLLIIWPLFPTVQKLTA